MDIVSNIVAQPYSIAILIAVALFLLFYLTIFRRGVRPVAASSDAGSVAEAEFPDVESKPSSTNAWLVLRGGTGQGKVYHIESDLITIGRDVALSDIVVNYDQSISRQHARIRRSSDGQYSIQDLATANGTLLNGQPIRRHLLKNGDEITLGRTSFNFRQA